MRRASFASAVVSCLFGIMASSASAEITVSEVGVNPFPAFPSTGGTGIIEGQQDGTATLAKTFTALGDVPIILHRNPTIGTDTIRINERVRNNTGVTWTDFHFLMQPIDANPLLGVSFQNITNPTGEWTTITPGLNSLTLLGSVPDGGTFSISFDLVVSSSAGSFDLFGIHEFPSIPEPSTLALLACSFVGLMSRPRGRRQSA